MNVKEFIDNFREAFGEAAGLPIVFWYSADCPYPTEKIPGCFFKAFDGVRSGIPVSLGVETIGCGGGKLYAGFSDMPPHVPGFVSGKERYVKTPEMVVEYVENLGMPRMDGQYLNFARVDLVDTFDGKEGVIFIATPDVLSGLAAWAFYDHGGWQRPPRINDKGVLLPETPGTAPVATVAMEAVSTPFGSGCSVMVSQPFVENRLGGRRCFLGLFDPSVRPWFGADELGFAIPMSRFREMLGTMCESCLFGTHAWDKIRSRISGGD